MLPAGLDVITDDIVERYGESRVGRPKRSHEQRSTHVEPGQIMVSMSKNRRTTRYRYRTFNVSKYRLTTAVFQLGLFLRALRPARTGLCPARFTRALPEFKTNKKKIIIILFYFLQNVILFLLNVIAVLVFSDSRCKNACKMLADLCPCFHPSPTRPNFGCSRVKDFVAFAH